ncbi:MAG: DNA polymerase III subunit delta' [Planctomycetaceae bacterium]|nr:DNA polymerase III subunit delta' [Planctomycetaceae bacterium]
MDNSVIWEQLKGHDNAVELFRRSIRRNRLSHAYLFTGPGGIGKRLFARLLAQCLFCSQRADEEFEACGECSACRQVEAGTYPDLIAVECPEGKSVLPIELFVGSKERRGREGLCHELSLRPMSADRRIALINDAHLMNAESANALLKTLEEPPPRAVMILIADRPEGLLPTIRSRCQLFRFAPLSREVLTELLLRQGLLDDRATAEEVADASEGSLEVARQLIDPGLRGLRETLYDRLAQHPMDRVAAASELLKALDELGGDSASQRNNALWLLRFCVAFYRRALQQLTGAAAGGAVGQVDRFVARCADDSPETLETVMALIERVGEAERQLNRSAPVGLCLEGLFDGLGKAAGV